MSDEGRLVADRYRVIQRIGTGAMGAVWQAQDEVLHRAVAIKQLLLQPGLDENEAEDARQRTMREGRIAARLHHPNAISVFDVVTDEHGQPCLIMEYLASTSLAGMLQQRKVLPPLEVARIGAQVAAALKSAHEVGVVHRDIKPGNVLLAENGTVKLTDFGISRAKDDVTVTKTGMIAGTPAYLAPEVAIGGDPGPESDVFALGSTLYAATEGQPPFGLSENTLGLLHAVAAGQINPPRQSGPLASVLAVMLHPEIEHRPTAEECEDLLAAVSRGETPLGGPADTTLVAPAAAGAVAGGALGAAAAEGIDDDAVGSHSGTLADEVDTAHYDDAPEDDPYLDVDGYPADDYDRYPQDDPQPTRAVPMGAAGYADYPDSGYDGYDGSPDDRDYDQPPDEEPEERGNWKVPAVIGGLVVVGMVALGVWIFGGSGGEEDPAQQPVVPAATTTTSSVPPTTTTTTTTTTVQQQPTRNQNPNPNTRTRVQTTQNNPQPPPPEPTSDQTEPTQSTTQPSTSDTSEPSDSTSTGNEQNGNGP